MALSTFRHVHSLRASRAAFSGRNARRSALSPQQMSQMSQMMSNPQIQEKMKELREDPELAPMFQDIQKNGMNAMMKYYSDPKFLDLLEKKMAGVPLPSAPPPTAAPAGMEQDAMQAAAMMQNPEYRAKLEQLKQDPELAPLFEDIQKNGPSALMKYWNDPKILAKMGTKLGTIPVPSVAAASAPPPMAPPTPEVTNLLEAARYGDLEAVEDFIAIGKDVNMADHESRTPLHFAVAYDHSDITRMLLEEGAQLEARDSKANTPLHYAAGYGRAAQVEILLEAGADTGARNGTGKNAADLIRAEPRNPLNGSPLLERLSS